MKGLVTRCVAKSKRRWVIQAPYIKSKTKPAWIGVGVITEMAPNRYCWSYNNQRGKEISLNHAHIAVNDAFVVDEVTKRMES